MPRRIKYRKAFKGIGFNETIVPNHRQLAFGQYGIRAMEHARLPARTIEAVRWVFVCGVRVCGWVVGGGGGAGAAAEPCESCVRELYDART